MTKKFLYLNRKAPYGTIYALESLEVVLIGAALGAVLGAAGGALGTMLAFLVLTGILMAGLRLALPEVGHYRDEVARWVGEIAATAPRFVL